MTSSLKRFFFFFSLGLSPLAIQAEPYLRIIQPFEGYDIPAVESSFVFGSVLPATASLTLNGVPVTPYKNGGFLAMIPFEEGKFQIEAVARDGVRVTTVTRTVSVAESPKTLPMNHGKIKPLSPNARVVLRAGDQIPMAFQGAPSGKASFRIGGRGVAYPLQEHAGDVKGIYKGIYTIQPTDKFENSDVVFTLKRKDGRRVTKKAGVKITVQKRKIPRFIRTKDAGVILTGPGSSYGYHLFVHKGIQLEVTGEWGEFNRVSLGKTFHGWIKKSVCESLPIGTPPARSTTRNIRVDVTDSSTLIEMPLKHRHAHRIEQSIKPHALTLTLYGVDPDSDRIRYLSKETVVKEITWVQNEPHTATFQIQTNQDQAWGYDLRYEGTKLILEIRHRPPNYSGWGNSLRGLRIAVDAGHSKGSFGTIGPWGNTEASVNLKTAQVIKEEFEQEGAEVVMIQSGEGNISLSDRVIRAWKARADLFISIHADATGEGNDPREREGFSVHYYHPQSRPFAEEIHYLYGQKMEIRDQGLWRSNLAVCRMTQMPSILLEMAYLILPEFEERLIDPKFHKSVADTLIASIASFMSQSEK